MLVTGSLLLLKIDVLILLTLLSISSSSVDSMEAHSTATQQNLTFWILVTNLELPPLGYHARIPMSNIVCQCHARFPGYASHIKYSSVFCVKVCVKLTVSPLHVGLAVESSYVQACGPTFHYLIGTKGKKESGG